MSDSDTIKAILELSKRTHDRVLEAFEGNGRLARELATHAKDDKEALERIEVRLDELAGADRKLASADKKIRAKVDSVADLAEQTGRHFVIEQRQWSKTARWGIRALITLVVATGTSAAAYHFGNEHAAEAAKKEKRHE